MAIYGANSVRFVNKDYALSVAGSQKTPPYKHKKLFTSELSVSKIKLRYSPVGPVLSCAAQMLPVLQPTSPSPSRPRTNGPHGSTHHHSVDRFFLTAPYCGVACMACGARQRPAPQPMTWNCMPGPTPCGTTTDSLDAKRSENAFRRAAPPRRLQGVAWGCRVEAQG